MSANVISLLQESLKVQGTLQQPWTSGIHKLSDAERSLFYKHQDGSCNYIKLGADMENSVDVEDLANACLPATFGRNQEDVLDEAYRKAGKMDYGDYAWPFNPESHNHLVSRLVSGLFPFGGLDYGIRFEPYKLNVYGKGSFFKSHVDTPRGENMFGSLVIILPLGHHKGGELVLRHQSKELVFNSNTLLANAESPSFAYVAFFSDVEHEVLEVTEGYRVSVTYNLYYDNEKAIPKPLAPSEIEVEHPFETALKRCFEDPMFRTTYQRLGFGLQHSYPRSSNVVDNLDDKWDAKREGLSHRLSFLKGVDLTIARIFAKHLDSGRLSIKSVHSFPYEKLDVVSSNKLDFGDDMWEDTEDIQMCLDESDKACIVWHKDAKAEDKKEYPGRTMRLTWVVNAQSSRVIGSSTYMHYGNEASLSQIYYNVCLVVDIRQ